MNSEEVITNARAAQAQLTDGSPAARMAQAPLPAEATLNQREAAIAQHFAQAAQFHAMAAAYLMGHGQQVAQAMVGASRGV